MKKMIGSFFNICLRGLSFYILRFFFIVGVVSKITFNDIAFILDCIKGEQIGRWL